MCVSKLTDVVVQIASRCRLVRLSRLVRLKWAPLVAATAVAGFFRIARHVCGSHTKPQIGRNSSRRATERVCFSLVVSEEYSTFGTYTRYVR